MWSGEEDPDADIWSGCRARAQVVEFAPFYDFALRRTDIESKEDILCTLLFLLIGGREGIEQDVESLLTKSFLNDQKMSYPHCYPQLISGN